MKVKARVHVLGMVPGDEREVDGRKRSIRSLLGAGWLEPVEDVEPEPVVAEPVRQVDEGEGEPLPGSGSGE